MMNANQPCFARNSKIITQTSLTKVKQRLLRLLKYECSQNNTCTTVFPLVYEHINIRITRREIAVCCAAVILHRYILVYDSIALYYECLPPIFVSRVYWLYIRVHIGRKFLTPEEIVSFPILDILTGDILNFKLPFYEFRARKFALPVVFMQFHIIHIIPIAMQ